jgi:hypothetical protein
VRHSPIFDRSRNEPLPIQQPDLDDELDELDILNSDIDEAMGEEGNTFEYEAFETFDE